MDIVYNKYVHCLLFFLKYDTPIALKNTESVLNNPADFYFDYDAEDEVKRCRRLFDHIFDMYVDSLNGQFYKACWHIIHTIPLIKGEQSTFKEYFLEEFLFERMDCLNCTTHYIAMLVDNPGMVQDDEQLFDKLVYLHNEINLSNNKAVIDKDAFRAELSRELALAFDFINY